MKWFVGIFGCLGLYMLLLWTSTAQARTHVQAQVTGFPPGASCAMVRCASGTCLDTPAGPVCEQALSCASTLCAQGNICKETASGPVCQPAKYPPVQPPQREVNHCKLVKTQAYGQSYYRRVCPPRRVDTPRSRYRKKHHPRRYGYDRPDRRHVHNRYCPPGHVQSGQDTPPVNPGRVYAKIYAPVCAQKQVQCVRAPCPPAQQSFGNRCEAESAGYTIIA